MYVGTTTNTWHADGLLATMTLPSCDSAAEHPMHDQMYHEHYTNMKSKCSGERSCTLHNGFLTVTCLAGCTGSGVSLHGIVMSMVDCA